MPRASYGDRNTVSVLKGEKNHVTFDTTSKVVDFCLIKEAETGISEALVVLAEEELIVVDLISPGWPCHNSRCWCLWLFFFFKFVRVASI